METVPQGVLLFDKPKGKTSFDLIQILRRKLGIKKIGHAGTLDPLASGLMVIGVGDGTKKLKQYVELPKVYDAEICIGEKSATGDAEGPIIESVSVSTIDSAKLEAVLESMQGVLRLEVSIYSAMKKGGEAFYKKARRGEKVTPPQRDMDVLEVTLLSEPKNRDDKVFLSVRFSVGSGTYIRSLAEELGRRLGYPARLENLRRVQVGDFCIKDAEKI